MAFIEDPDQLLIFTTFALGALMFYLLRPDRKKTLSGEQLAERLGLRFATSSPKAIASKFSFINRMQYGDHKSISNILSGEYKKHAVWAFYLRYQGTAMSPNDTPNDLFTFFILKLPKTFPEVTIYPEGLISKLYQATGHPDIDFESHEFSRKFRVRSDSPRFAYDFCHPRMIERLLELRHVGVEIDEEYLCLSYNRLVLFEEFEYNLNHLISMRELMPDYLFED